MNSKQAGIYLIVSKINGKRYIGSSVRICVRWSEHISDLRLNKHHSPLLQRHYNKYGEDDLVFSVLEVVDRAELSLNDFRQLLLDKEQIYLNNWDECHFNCSPIAGSKLGYKNPKAKYYVYSKSQKLYIVNYRVCEVVKRFSSFYTEEEAKTQVEYIKSLTEQQLIDYQLECSINGNRQNRNNRNNRNLGQKKQGAKNYRFDKRVNKYVTQYTVLGKSLEFSYHITEEEAIKQVEYLRTLSNDELLKYKEECLVKPSRNPKNVKFYSWDKKSNKYIVRISVNGVKTYYGSYATEQEAIDKVNELKQELVIK